MRVNVYAEEMTDRIEIISKEIEGTIFTGLRFYLALPASFVPNPQPPDNGDNERPANINDTVQAKHYQAPFIHRPGDDDSAAVTFWGKKSLRSLLLRALAELEAHESARASIERKHASVITSSEICGGAKSGLDELHPGIEL